MRGFLLGALVLVGLDLLLTSTSASVAGAAVLPAQWLAKWMSPAVPLITAPVPAPSSSSSPSPASTVTQGIGLAQGIVTGLNPSMEIGNLIASKVTGK